MPDLQAIHRTLANALYPPDIMATGLQILITAQAGRLEAEALLFAASLQATGTSGLTVAVPQAGPLWPGDLRLSRAGSDALQAMGAMIRPFALRHFGTTYPNGNRIEALQTLTPGRPFVVFDTDTMILAPLACAALEHAGFGASPKVETTWPKPRNGRGRRAVWRALYDRFDLPFPDPPPYFCAARVHGPCPYGLAAEWTRIATAIRNDPGPALDGQAIYPWLDQIALPLALARLGGAAEPWRDHLLDHHLSWHYRSPALAYARAPDRVIRRFERLTRSAELRALLCRHPAFGAVLDGDHGSRARALYPPHARPARERPVRRRLKAAGLWDR